MPIKRGKDGRWRYRESIRLPNGTSKRISGSAPRHCNTKAACKEELLEHIAREKDPRRRRKEGITFSEWFEGRFWREWVIARKNKPSEQVSKQSVYKVHLKPAFGDLSLTEIGVGEIARFRADLIESGRSDKTINNILAVLSKALRYAEDVELIDRAPRVGLLRVERPEIVPWSLAEYARLIAAARQVEPRWLLAACLAGEAGMRVGEIRALDWQRDVDLIAGIITINCQRRHGVTGTPKGRTRRVVPMTKTLEDTLLSLPCTRQGYVVSNLDGSPVTDDQTGYQSYRLCRKAGLPERGWHTLRHSFGTHAAMLGVNPWKLMHWMGHKRIDETMRYVHFAEIHQRPLPRSVLEAGAEHQDPDQRVIAMLGARSEMMWQRTGKTPGESSKTPRVSTT